LPSPYRKVGLAAGGPAAAGFGHLQSSRLFGVSAHDPATFAAMTIVVGGTALAACLVPARRAVWVDPLTALRGE
jgi:putative ABC transport system permease protein